MTRSLTAANGHDNALDLNNVSVLLYPDGLTTMLTYAMNRSWRTYRLHVTGRLRRLRATTWPLGRRR